MKKLLGILVLGLLLVGCASPRSGDSNISAADEPYYENSLNKNILEHGWEIVSKTDGGLTATEIYKLKKKWLDVSMLC